MAGKEFTDYLHAAPQTGPEFRRDFVAPPDRKREPLLDERQHAAAQKMEIKRHANATFEGLPVNGVRYNESFVINSVVVATGVIIDAGVLAVPKGYVGIVRNYSFSMMLRTLPSDPLTILTYPVFPAIGGPGARLLSRVMIDDSAIAGYVDVILSVNDEVPVYIVANENQRVAFQVYLDPTGVIPVAFAASTTLTVEVDYIPIKTAGFRETIIEG